MGPPNPFGFWYLCNFKEVKWNKCDFKMALTLLWSNILLKLSRSDSFFPILMKNGQCMYVVDVLWGQPIKLIQVVSTSEFHEYWWNDVVFIFFVPSTLCRASEASNIDCFKNWVWKLLTKNLNSLLKKCPYLFPSLKNEVVMTYFMMLLLRPCTKWRGGKK